MTAALNAGYRIRYASIKAPMEAMSTTPAAMSLAFFAMG
jgi:hypothetical protein